MELIVFIAIAVGLIYVLYKAYGPQGTQAPKVNVSDVAAKAETVVAEVKAEVKPAKKTAAKKPAVKKATTRKPKASK